MFNGCSSLKTAAAPYVYNIETNLLGSMYANCTSLTDAVVPIFAGGNYSMSTMFANCTSLSCIEVTNSTSWPTGNSTLTSWVENVSPTGIFKCKAALPDERGPNRIPNNWTKVDI